MLSAKKHKWSALRVGRGLMRVQSIQHSMPLKILKEYVAVATPKNPETSEPKFASALRSALVNLQTQARSLVVGLKKQNSSLHNQWRPSGNGHQHVGVNGPKQAADAIG